VKGYTLYFNCLFCHTKLLLLAYNKVCACSTCHVILEEKLFEKLPEPSEAEEDMLDMAFGLTSTSRLSCQIKITEDFDGTTISIPKATRNFYVVP